MKILITIIISILFVSTSFAQQDLLPAFPKEISYKDNVAYFNGSPFTGLLVEEKTNKKLGEFKNGYKEGIFTEYYTNGKKKSEYNYANGKIVDGEYTTYLENGQKYKEEIYKEGELVTITNYKEGKLIDLFNLSIEEYPSGKKKSRGYYKNRSKDGLWTYWYENGQKQSEGNYKDGNLDSLWFAWFGNGRKESEGIYKNGKRDGQWVSWYENGKIEYKGNYINDKKNGEFIYEDERTGLQKIIFYKDGEIDVHTTNLVKYYKPAKNSKLLRVSSNETNEFSIVN